MKTEINKATNQQSSKVTTAGDSRHGKRLFTRLCCFSALLLCCFADSTQAQVAIFGKTIHTMAEAGDITDGVVVIVDGKIKAVGPAATTIIPDGLKQLRAEVVTPGLIDAHSTVGLSGIYNTKADSDQLERSGPMQPELRAIDAYNPQEPLIAYVRSFGVTTLHTGHAPGELISGQTIIVKTRGNTVDEALIRSPAMVAATISPMAEKDGAKSPGSRGKMLAMLRQELVKAQEYKKKMSDTDVSKRPARDLHLDMLVDVLDDKVPLMVTAHRAQDIASAIRLRDEFGFRLVLDGACEAYLLLDQIKLAGAGAAFSAPIPIILHPTMMRAYGETENASMATAAKLDEAGVFFALQAGYEGYVPKTRIVLFEAAVAAGHGLSKDGALRSITINAARLLNIHERTGSLEVGKDGDVALYDGDPLEYTSHCVGTVIDGVVEWEGKR